MTHPFHDVAIVGVFNTRQARALEGETGLSIAVEAAAGALADAGMAPQDVDGVVDPTGGSVIFDLGLGPVWRGAGGTGIGMVLEAASAIATGLCETVLLPLGQAGRYIDREATAPWTRPDNEFIATWGLYTAVEFALVARRHMELYGTTPDQLATVSATIRNNGSDNPDAVYYGRGPFSTEDILGSRMVADPFHLLDCSTTSEGGSAIVITTCQRALDTKSRSVFMLGGGCDVYGLGYQHPPAFDLRRGSSDFTNGWIGERAARQAFRTAGLGPTDVDVCEFYDPFSFEIIRQLEAFGFCPKGEGGDFVQSGDINIRGALPIVTDGGTMSYSHAGNGVQTLQRVTRAVEQIRGTCQSNQLDSVEVAMCSNGGAGALWTDVLLLGPDRP